MYVNSKEDHKKVISDFKNDNVQYYTYTHRDEKANKIVCTKYGHKRNSNVKLVISMKSRQGLSYSYRT